MRIETKSILLYALTQMAFITLFGYIDYIGYWTTDLLGSYLVFTILGKDYNLAFLVDIAIGVIIIFVGVKTDSKYADYLILAFGGAWLVMGAVNIFPVLIQPNLA